MYVNWRLYVVRKKYLIVYKTIYGNWYLVEANNSMQWGYV